MNRLPTTATLRRLATAALLTFQAASQAQPPASAAQPTAAAPKVLLVVSSEGRVDASGNPVRPGFKMDEFALAGLALRANGLEVEVASPSGGAVTAERYKPQDDHIQAMKSDARATAALAITRRTQEMPKLVVDDRLITGQNPVSTTLAAEAVVRALGRTPVAPTLLREDASMQVVQWWLAGEQAAARALLAADPARYKTDLIAMLGLYHHGAATDNAARRQAISVMELAAPHFNDPRFQFGLAQAQAQARNKGRARELLQLVLAAKPGDAEATKALAGLAG